MVKYREINPDKIPINMWHINYKEMQAKAKSGRIADALSYLKWKECLFCELIQVGKRPRYSKVINGSIVPSDPFLNSLFVISVNFSLDEDSFVVQNGYVELQKSGEIICYIRRNEKIIPVSYEEALKLGFKIAIDKLQDLEGLTKEIMLHEDPDVRKNGPAFLVLLQQKRQREANTCAK